MSTETNTGARPRRFTRGVKGLAAYLGMEDQERLVRRWVSDEGIPSYQPGGRVIIFDLDQVDAWLEERRRAPRARRESVVPRPRRRRRAVA